MTVVTSTTYSSLNVKCPATSAKRSTSDEVFIVGESMYLPKTDEMAHADTIPSTVEMNVRGKLVNATLVGAEGSSLKAFNPAELPEDKYQTFIELAERRLEANKLMLEHEYTTQPAPPDMSNWAGDKAYATVMVGGRIVATITNQGVVETRNDSLGQKLQDILIDEVNGKNGPDLAQARAQQIAKLLGGRMQTADTAISQREYDALPTINAIPTTDYETMKQDPQYVELRQMYENLNDIREQRKGLLLQ